MLVFLILFAFLQTLQGRASIPPPHASSSVNGANVFVATACECPVSPDDGGQQFRTINSIVQSCLLTIFACVWTSAHPNINSPRDSRWTCFRRRVFTMLYMLMAPELGLLWALRQRSNAKQIAEMYNKNFAKSGEVETETLWGKIVSCFRPLPKETTWRGDGQLWTTAHGFFIQMGGFILYEKGYPKEVLDYPRLGKLLKKQAIDAPTVTERDLQDRSKSDTVSKAILVLQTTWFVLQCVARWGQHLPLSELEVLTLAFAVLNVAIYAVWWDKPQGVEMAICVPLKEPEKDIHDSTTSTTGEEQQEPESLSDLHPPGLLHPDYQRSNDDVPLMPPHQSQPDVSAGQKHSWLRRMLRKDREQHSTPFFLLFFLPYRIVVSILRLAVKSGDPGKFEKQDLRVPMFYASAYVDDTAFLPSSIIGTIFGAIHLLAWTSEFPSSRDCVLWRVAAVVLTVVPFLMLLSTTMSDMLKMEMIGDCIVVLFIPVAPFYIPARFAVVIIAFLAIRNPSQDILRNVSWTSYIPHF